MRARSFHTLLDVIVSESINRRRYRIELALRVAHRSLNCFAVHLRFEVNHSLGIWAAIRTSSTSDLNNNDLKQERTHVAPDPQRTSNCEGTLVEH